MGASYHRHDINDKVWKLLEPHLPGQRGLFGFQVEVDGDATRNWYEPPEG